MQTKLTWRSNNSPLLFLFSYLEKFCDLICTALLSNIQEQSEIVSHKCCVSIIPEISLEYPETCSIVTGANLPDNCVLKRILSVQQLDQLGCEEYLKYVNQFDLDNYGYVDLLLEEIKKQEFKCARCTLVNVLRYFSPEEAHKKLGSLFFVPYLVAAVARDCSIMLTFREVENGIIRYLFELLLEKDNKEVRISQKI